MKLLPRLICIAAVLAGLMISGAWPGTAPDEAFAANFGGYRLEPSGFELRGTRAGITPPVDFALADRTHAIMRVTSQSCLVDDVGCTDFSAGLIQVGFGKTRNSDPGCGDMGILSNLYEFKPANGGLFRCGWVGPELRPNYHATYMVYRRPERVTGSVTHWAAFIDGQLKASADVGYDTAGVIGASGEINGAGDLTRGDLQGCYGCPSVNGTGVSWQRTNVAGGGLFVWTAIQQAQLVNDGTWTVQPLPSPFRISHAN